MVEWITSTGLQDYTETIKRMELRVDAIAKHQAEECIWLLEHPPLFTAGSSVNPNEFDMKLPFPIYKTGRGGLITYHGPGQRVIYMMLDISKRGRDLRKFVTQSEQWIINSLADLGVESSRLPPHIGVWIKSLNKDLKIAAIGFRIRNWISFHGISINVNPDLSHYDSIVPCGIEDKGVTSLDKCLPNTNMHALDAALKENFENSFSINKE